MTIGVAIIPTIAFVLLNVGSIALFRSPSAGGVLGGSSGSQFVVTIYYSVALMVALVTAVLPLIFTQGVTYGQMVEKFKGKGTLVLGAIGVVPVVAHLILSILTDKTHPGGQSLTLTMLQQPNAAFALFQSFLTQLVYGILIVMVVSMSSQRDRIVYLAIRFALLAGFSVVSNLLIRSQYSANIPWSQGILDSISYGLLLAALSYYAKGRNTAVVAFIVVQALVSFLCAIFVIPLGSLSVISTSVICYVGWATLLAVLALNQDRTRTLVTDIPA